MSKTVMRTGESSPVGAACPFGLKPCPKGSGLRRVSRAQGTGVRRQACRRHTRRGEKSETVIVPLKVHHKRTPV